MVNSQAFLFGIFIVNGLIIGIIFDFFRILRRSFKTGSVLTSLEDIIFWIIVGAIVLYSIFTFNNGEIRGYMFLGISLGIAFYMFTISSFIIKINVKIIKFIKKILFIILNIIIKPLKTVIKICRKIILKPITFIIINIKKLRINRK
jgi:spore cortex biosynthesis protein YabQ